MALNPRKFLDQLLESLRGTSLEAQHRKDQSKPNSEDERHASRTKRKKDQHNNAKALPSSARNILLTLHLLFPHILLDSLDLLDRGCVVKVHIKKEASDEEGEGDEVVLHHSTYYVLSARSKLLDGHGEIQRGTAEPGKLEEDMLEHAEKHAVHLRGWNCSCPAFAFAAYAADVEASPVSGATDDTGAGVGFGGMGVSQRRRLGGGEDEGSVEVAPPVCKHLLACLLSEVAPGMFGPFAETDEQHVGGGGVREVVVGALVAAGLAADV